MRAEKSVSELVRRIEGYNEGFEIISIIKNGDEYTIVVKEVPVKETK